MLDLNKFLVIANWKMNLPSDLSEYIEQIEDSSFSCELVLSLPFTHLSIVGSELTKSSLAAQNVFHEEEGSFTGEISAKFLKDLRVKYCIVGHSERRGQESFEDILQKVDLLVKEGIIPIVCLSLNEIEKKDILSLSHFSDKIVVAYEPLSAIGSGKPASIEDIGRAAEYIKRNIDTMVVYGGSVSDINFKEIANINGIDGLLIGKASLDKEKLRRIIEGI